MDDTPQMNKLLKLLGEHRLAIERQKGREARMSAATLMEQHTITQIQNDSTKLDDENEKTSSAILNRNHVDHSGPSTPTLGNRKGSANSPRKTGALSRFSAPWSDSEDSEEDETTLEVGEEAVAGMRFCPLMAISRFPYKYLSANKRLMEGVADTAFNDGKFWERRWTV